MKRFGLLLAVFCTFSQATFGGEADWSKGVSIPREGLANRHSRSATELAQSQQQGLGHILSYPYQKTGILFPIELFDNLNSPQTPQWLKSAAAILTPFQSTADMEEWLGLAKFDGEEFKPPFREGLTGRLGTTFIEKNNTIGITFGCPACHSSTLFGKSVMGVQNRFTKAIDFFGVAKKTLPLFPNDLMEQWGYLSSGGNAMIKETKTKLRRIGTSKPQTLGLDSSIAFTGGSLARRGSDPYATPDRVRERNPSTNLFDNLIADSKPGVWWTLKYKNRWYLDGSLVSGQPVIANFLSNEIGRGVDLKEFEEWLISNKDIIEAMTDYVFSIEPPLYTDFFAATDIDLESAKRGQKLFRNNCKGCHGDYIKGWEDPEVADITDQLATTKVLYHEKTPVIDVGTDPHRYQGMAELARGAPCWACTVGRARRRT